MLTDYPTRKNRAGFLESDHIKTLDLPPNGPLPDVAKCLESAMKADSLPHVRTACAEFLATASDFYRVPKCGIRVLAARPMRVRPLQEKEARKAQQTIDPQNNLARLPDVSCREALISAWPTAFQMTSMCRTEWLADSITIPEVTFLRILHIATACGPSSSKFPTKIAESRDCCTNWK